MNCRKYHAVLSNDEGWFHIHDWCEQWKTVLNAYALADKREYACPYNSDLETGEAYCYMFEAADTPSYPDEWFDKNKAENEANGKRSEYSNLEETITKRPNRKNETALWGVDCLKTN